MYRGHMSSSLQESSVYCSFKASVSQKVQELGLMFSASFEYLVTAARNTSMRIIRLSSTVIPAPGLKEKGWWLAYQSSLPRAPANLESRSDFPYPVFTFPTRPGSSPPSAALDFVEENEERKDKFLCTRGFCNIQKREVGLNYPKKSQRAFPHLLF